MQTVGINGFVLRQTADDFPGTKVPKEYMGYIREQVQDYLSNEINVFPSYAPFCKVVVIENDIDVLASYIHVNDIPEGSEFEPGRWTKRREEEDEYWQKERVILKEVPKAKYLHCVVYTQEQLNKENANPTGADFDLISINAEMDLDAAPMVPETIKRNASGKGGSGHQASEQELRESEEFWSQHYFIA